MKAIKILTLLALVTFSLSLICIPNAQAYSTIVDHYYLTGRKGRMQVSIYVYKASDTVPNKDFYSIRIFAYFNEWIDRSIMEISSKNGICDYWKPSAGSQGGSIGFSYLGISFSVSVPTGTYVHVYGGFTSNFKMDQLYFWDVLGTEISTGWYVPQGQRLHWKLRLRMFDEIRIWFLVFPRERDRVELETWSG